MKKNEAIDNEFPDLKEECDRLEKAYTELKAQRVKDRDRVKRAFKSWYKFLNVGSIGEGFVEIINEIYKGV